MPMPRRPEKDGKIQCTACKGWLEYNQYSNRSESGRPYSKCKKCVNKTATEWRMRNPEKLRAKILRGYSLTLANFYELLTSQGGGCAICGTKEPKWRGWHVDHNHKCCDSEKSCGKCVRGILCGYCNATLGYVKDNPDILRLAIVYLEKNKI